MGWQHGNEHDTDSLIPGQFRHRGNVARDLAFGDRTRIPRNVVRTCKDHDDLRTQRQDVGPKASEHLESSLSGDASIDARAVAKVRGIEAVQRSTIESPMKTTRASRGSDAARTALAS
jgi:hypothetical protein